MARFCEVLEMNTSLLSLRLKYCGLTDMSAASLANALKINSTLTTLNLRANDIKNEGMVSLRNALIWNQTLTYLNLGYNKRSLKNIYVVSPRNWIVRKNQSLFDLLFQYLNKIEAAEGNSPDSTPESSGSDDSWGLSSEDDEISSIEEDWDFSNPPDLNEF